MATKVIMPVLGISQDSGKILHWFKSESQMVQKGEPLFEVETDKSVVEIEAPVSGVLVHIYAAEGTDVPVTDVVAIILGPGEIDEGTESSPEPIINLDAPTSTKPAPVLSSSRIESVAFPISPLAAKIAAEQQVDIARVKPKGSRIEKADILAYLEEQENSIGNTARAGRFLASPKARRLAVERGVDITGLEGSGPDGAVLAMDIPQGNPGISQTSPESAEPQSISTIWRIMAERTTSSWMTVPHFFLLRDVNTSRLTSWREKILKQASEKITYSDLLVKIVAAALRKNPAVNASWQNETVVLKNGIHIGLAVAVDGGLVVPVIHDADLLSVEKIAKIRIDLVQKARAGKLRPQDIENGTFTISNLGMYGVDAFNAIINSPQAAILAVGRISDRVVPMKGLPSVQPMMTLSLSCDHRVLDGARGAQFLETIADLIEEPAALIQ